MIWIRLIALAAVLTMIAAIVIYLVTGHRKYLQFSLRLLKISVIIILLLLSLLVADRVIDLLKS